MVAEQAEEYVFSWDDLTFEDLEFLEDYTGVPIGEIAKPERQTAKVVIAMAYVVARKSDPALTIEDFKKQKISEAGPLVAEVAPANRAERRASSRSQASRKQSANRSAS